MKWKGEKMTRKDFKVIAQILKLVGLQNIEQGTREKIDGLLHAQNPAYSSEKFWDAVAKK